MSKLRFNYGFRAHEVLHHPEAPQRIRRLKECGVETIWLDGYFYGHYEADDETMLAAKRRLEDEGFDVNAISVPVGHPGNSLNPEDDTLELEIPKTWRYRMEPDCKPHFFCACIEDVMVEDNGRAAEKYAQMGFRKLFFDDDLRMGECGREIGGCFCPACMKEFNQRTGLALQPKALDAMLRKDEVDCSDEEKGVRAEWIRYNCEKVTRLLKRCDVPGLQIGTMLMYKGDRRHGLDVEMMKAAVPNCMFRVGELHFSDADYLAPGGREALSESVRGHMSRIGANDTYSESTVFPPRAMSPETLMDKLRLEVRLGLRNIFLMSGTWFLTEPYWKALAAERPNLEALAEKLNSAKFYNSK